MPERLAAGLLLAVPVVLAFFSGGYFAAPRAWAGVAVWALVAVGCVLGRPLRGRASWLAFGGLAGLALWTLASIAWAPLRASAYGAAQITFLYLGAMLAAALLLGNGALPVEPALALGALVVVGYGLSERLLPGLLTFTHSISAQGRLEQPLTYWNAMGLVAAVGLLLCARLSGPWLAGAPLLGLGLALTVSRGGILAALAGLLTLVVLTRRREQLAAAVAVVALAVFGALAGAWSDPVTSLTGAHRERDGAIVLVLLVALSAAALPAARIVRRRAGTLRLPAEAGTLTCVLVAVGIGVALILGQESTGTSSSRLTPTARRLVTLQSNRYEYWRVAARAWRDEPVRGVGAGGWAVRWLRERPYAESAHDAHSLPLQTLAELGLVGLALLGVWVGGVALAARAGPAGLAAVCVAWGVHVLLDWDFEMPAATLPVMLAAGALLGYAGTRA